MRYFAALVVLIVSVLSPGAAAEARGCARIVSLAPSITETLYELGLGDRLVGVTRFCRYPEQAQTVQKVGGLFDLNLEQILTLKPTHVFALHENIDALQPLLRFGISIVQVDHRTVEGIKQSFSTIGEKCDVQARAAAILHDLRQREKALLKKLEGAPSLKTLVVVGRTHEGSRLSGVYVSGSDGFYSDVLALIGSTNVNRQRTIALPTLSPEGLLSLGAEAVVEISNQDDGPVDVEKLKSLWTQYPRMPAVVRGRVGILTEDFASIPGPRYILLAERIARILYPDR
jgi:iron complex transport system substrate-binding protein